MSIRLSIPVVLLLLPGVCAVAGCVQEDSSSASPGEQQQSQAAPAAETVAASLDLYIAVRDSDLTPELDIDRLRQQLANRGPDRAKSELVRWLPIHDPEHWSTDPDDLATLKSDPVSFFAARHDCVAAEQKGDVYLLVHTAPQKCMTHDGGPGWSILAALRDKDARGRPAVRIRLDPKGASAIGALTQRHLGERIAMAVDGEVYAGPMIQSRFSNSFWLMGQYTQDEVETLCRRLHPPQSEPSRLTSAP